MNGVPSCHFAPLARWKVTPVPSGLTSQDLASEAMTLPEASRRTRPWYRLSSRIVAMDAVASAVGSSEVGSWMKPTIGLGLGRGRRARSSGGRRRRGGALWVGRGGRRAGGSSVGWRLRRRAPWSAPRRWVGGEVGATAVVAEPHAASNAEAIGSQPRRRPRRNVDAE